MTAVGALGGLFNPFIGLLIYIMFAIISPDHLWSWSLGGGNYSRIVALGMLAGWFVHRFGDWKLKRAWPVIGLFIAYWLLMIVCTFGAEDQERSWGLVEFYAKILIPVLVGISMIKTVNQLKTIAWVVLLSMGYIGFEMNLYYLSGNNVARDGYFEKMDNNCLAIEMVTGVGLSFFLALGSDKLWKQGLAMFCAALMAHTILISFSRGGMLAMGMTGLLAFIMIPKKPQHYLLFLVVLAFGIRMAGPQVQKRFFSSFGSNDGLEASAQSRLDLWRDAMDIALKNPVFGVGADNWGDYAPDYGWKKGKEVHSLWVQNAAELGFPGALMLMGFFGLCMWRLWPIARAREKVVDPWLCDAARMVVASLFGFVVAAQFVTIKYLEAPFYVALLGAGILKVNTITPPRFVPLPPPPPTGRKEWTPPRAPVEGPKSKQFAPTQTV